MSVKCDATEATCGANYIPALFKYKASFMGDEYQKASQVSESAPYLVLWPHGLSSKLSPCPNLAWVLEVSYIKRQEYNGPQ